MVKTSNLSRSIGGDCEVAVKNLWRIDGEFGEVILIYHYQNSVLPVQRLYAILKITSGEC